MGRVGTLFFSCGAAPVGTMAIVFVDDAGKMVAENLGKFFFCEKGKIIKVTTRGKERE